MAQRLTAVQITVWEEIAVRQLTGQLPPTTRELRKATNGQSLAVFYYTLNVLEHREKVIVCPRDDRGHRRPRCMQLVIWPASFGVGANRGLS